MKTHTMYKTHPHFCSILVQKRCVLHTGGYGMCLVCESGCPPLDPLLCLVMVRLTAEATRTQTVVMGGVVRS